MQPPARLLQPEGLKVRQYVPSGGEETEEGNTREGDQPKMDLVHARCHHHFLKTSRGVQRGLPGCGAHTCYTRERMHVRSCMYACMHVCRNVGRHARFGMSPLTSMNLVRVPGTSISDIRSWHNPRYPARVYVIDGTNRREKKEMLDNLCEFFELFKI